MKKIYLLLSTLLITGSFAQAQDTLLFEDFELANFYSNILIDCNATSTTPPGVAVDTNWYSMDSDGLPDASTGGGRPDGYYASYPFSTVDQYETVYGTIPAPDTNTVISAGSWTNDIAPCQNWLITSSIQLGIADTLFWKSAPIQAPRYLDGYQVLLSTTTNTDNIATFSTVLFNASEMTGTPFGGASGTSVTYSDFSFAPTAAGGPVAIAHGQDGNNLDAAGTTAPISRRGQLRQFSVPLNAYPNMNVFIAFLHNTHDDNAISFDDVMIRGTLTTIGVNENANDLGLNLFPNPATDNVQVNYSLTSETAVTINVYDVAGKLVSTVSEGEQAQGRHFAHINTSSMSKGFYTVNVVTSFGQSTSKLIVK